MERILKNTNLFEPDLRAKISNESISNTDDIKKDAIYDLTVFFYAGLLRDDMNIEAFEIPEEALPRYRRGKIMSKKDKVYELLSYQINIFIDYLEEYDVVLSFCNIVGTPLCEPDELNIKLQVSKSSIDNEFEDKGTKRKRKNEKPYKVISIMPSLLGFAANLEQYFKNKEQRELKELQVAFGEIRKYEKYADLFGKTRLYEIYNTFKEEYGEIYSFQSEENEKLRRKFLAVVKEHIEPVISEKSSDNQSNQTETLNFKLIYAIPVFKRKKTTRGARKYVGYANLITDGKIIRFEYKANHKAYEQSQTMFTECFYVANKKDSSNNLLNHIRLLAEQADNECLNYAYALELEVVDNVLSFMELNAILKKIRKENLT